jgi:hypothetical protein
MSRSIKPLPILLACVGVLSVGSLLIGAFILYVAFFVSDGKSFSSDHLYCFHFCDDLLQGRDVQGFHLPGAPYLFPDMVVVLGCRALTSDLFSGFILYAVIYYGLLLATLIAVMRRLGISGLESFLIAGLSLSALFATYTHPAYLPCSLFLFHPSNHMGCLLIGLGATAFVLGAVRNGYRWFSAALFVVVCAVSGFSDQLMIVQFFAPICVAALLLGACRLFPFRRALITTALLGLSTLLAANLRYGIAKLGFVPLRIESSYHWDILASGEQFLASWSHCVREQPILWIACFLHVAAASTVLLVWSRRGRSPEISTVADGLAEGRGLHRTAVLLAALVGLLAPMFNAAAMIVTGLVNEPAVERYLFTWLYLPFLCVILWARLLPWRAARIVPWVVAAFVVFRLFTYPALPNRHDFEPRYPPLAQALDEMARKHGHLRGFAEFWNAREMYYLTHENVHVLPIISSGMPWFHSFNPNSFLSDDPHDLSLPDYHFVVVPRHKGGSVDREQILARYGKPAEILLVDHNEIWRYDRMISRQLDLFLRAQLAQRLVKNKPFVGPSEPSRLRKPKRNLTAWDDAKNILLDRGGSLTLRFDKPIAGDMIDISANALGCYLLRFARDGKELGSTRVPSVEWTGAESAYCKPGLQSRLVPVPPACRTEGFNEVRVFPAGRSEHFSLGHFLVFDEWIPYQSGWERRYEPYHRYEGEKLNHPNSPEVTTIQDPSASNGQAQQASSAFEGCLVYGPYTILSPGHYRVEFALRVEDNRSTDVVATLDSCAFGSEEILHSLPLRGVDFPSTNQYTVFSFTFDADDELDLVEFRAIVHAKAKVTLDYIDVTRTGAASSSDER